MCQQNKKIVSAKKLTEAGKFLFSLLWVSVLSNCSSTRENICLPQNLQQQIGSTDVYVEECEKKMEADVERSNITQATGGGLLPALVDSFITAHRESCAEDAMMGIQKEIRNFDFREKFASQLEDMLRKTDWLHVREVSHIKGIREEEHEEMFKNANSDGILVSKFIYKLNSRMDTLRGTLHLALYPASEKMRKIANVEKPLENPVFKVHISATESLPNPTNEIQNNGEMWAQDKGTFLKKTLEKILAQLLARLQKALDKPGRLPEA